ncbi:Crp/Fnr family transcriptional regulator [Pelagivirga sediminicola]|uniref:Crp/Fnr family transcriptional regulator n=1 Tax=Pelagivirga sediminicola TaxID=2170575 RepID=A0A2T7G8D7_9RHOB|nr:Crp/Fnr family transcriptional regulator [Pelagivirga sediminicola]PVA10683.1 Crp/Fnr family transcriptional regulator [Pelagivirga sediminicola]
MRKLDESLLTHLPPFSELGREQIREILDRATPQRYDTGDTVFHEGEEAGRFFLLLDGYVRVVRMTAEGEHVTVLHIAAGQLFGIAAALGNERYPASAVAASDTIALGWPMRLWHDFTATYPGFAASGYKTVGNRMEEIHKRVVEMATQQVEQRVANALLRLITQMGRRTDAGIEVDFPITRQDLSEMTGTTLHTVSRLLSAWEKRGIVESKRKHIMVREPHQLVMLAEPAVSS